MSLLHHGEKLQATLLTMEIIVEVLPLQIQMDRL
jgi:hypothetical protein